MRDVLLKRIEELVSWMDSTCLESSDPFSLQCNKLAISLGKLSPRPIAYGLSVIERNHPDIVAKFTQKTISAHTVALYVQSRILLGHNASDLLAWLIWLIEHANKKHCGYSWGIPFPWLMGDGVLAPENTPMSTVTPYCSDAFYLAHKFLNMNSAYGVAVSGAEFIMCSLNRTYESENSTSLSYSPLDNYQIINANAYSAAQLYRAYHYTQNSRYKRLADKLVNFILEEQNEDGSWYYWSSHQRVNEGIDSLHQSYTTQGLARVWLINKDPKIKSAIDANIDYIKKNLITKDLLVKKFPDKKHPYELIDAAELAVTLCMVGDPLAGNVLARTALCFTLRGEPFFASRIHPTTTVPYLRWGESQMLYAMVLEHVLDTKQKTIEEIYS